MARTFFDRRVALFGNRAVLILCIVFFLAPFAGRGARMSVQRIENNIKDWLPSDFPETKDLEWFASHFVGERFILLTWPGCTQSDPRFQLLVKKLQSEIAPREAADDAEQPASDEERVSRLADRLGLFPTDEQFQNWGGRQEKWIQGSDQRWYFITPEGNLYAWDGDSNVLNGLLRVVKKLLGKEMVAGELLATVGQTRDGQPSPYYAEPRKLTARLFGSLRTGPEMLAELTVEDGPLWPRGTEVADEDKPLVAKQIAYERLTGTLFGPAVPAGFRWESQEFLDLLPEQVRRQLPLDWRQKFEGFVERVVEREYGGDRDALLRASRTQQTRHWDELFTKLRVASPPRQTCLIVTMSEVGKRDLKRVIGRPLLGAPMGRLLDLAINECNISVDDLKMGGPPVDNVAIDEEGTITLVRLVGFSALVGIGLSWLCFRSVRVTCMIFFVGGLAAVSSLAIVFWSSRIPALAGLSSVDAVLMSMPALVYVLGLSGAVHIVNYYREAAEEDGIPGAAERALAHGWGPCTLAALTTALGLISLFTSNLAPIKKFGLFSALGVMATLLLLFTFLPSALTIWPFAPRRKESPASEEEAGVGRVVEKAWLAVGEWVTAHHGLVTCGAMLLMIVVGWGLSKINTSVQLLKLFDADSKIISDYRWLETNFGRLVPMELVVEVDSQVVRPPLDELATLKDEHAYHESTFQLNLLERLELVDRIQKVCEREFGESKRDAIGKGMSAATFLAEFPAVTDLSTRGAFNSALERQQSQLPHDYVRFNPEGEDHDEELWRISERLTALSDVDFGSFLHEQKLAVEPILTAYRYRDTILRELDRLKDAQGVAKSRVVFLGADDPHQPASAPADEDEAAGEQAAGDELDTVNQTRIFGATLSDLLVAARCLPPKWHDPATKPVAEFADWGQTLASVDCIVLLKDHPDYDVDFIREHASLFVDARDHVFDLGRTPTAAERGDPIRVVYTGVVPVVYKAQRTLLNSLVESIAVAFVMIAVVMMILLRDWSAGLSIRNSINLPAGLISMIPNIFPVVMIFGAMGHARIVVDIGTMMCASVAMGVAVDDTIHFLTWFRMGLREGMSRLGAIKEAYRRVATAMTQTTLIGGLGLSVFALSTFTPTQRFGVMMITLLVAALIGDLILLPALLAGPLGRFFELIEAKRCSQDSTASSAAPSEALTHSSRTQTRHSSLAGRGDAATRTDGSHPWPRH